MLASSVCMALCVCCLLSLSLRSFLTAVALCSLSPPGSYYPEDVSVRIMDGVHVTGAWEMDSLIKTPKWTSGWQVYRGTPFDEHLVVVIDVKTLKPKGEERGRQKGEESTSDRGRQSRGENGRTGKLE